MGYLKPGLAELNYLRHLILMYGYDKDSWTERDLRYYVAHIGKDGVPDDWFYDSFLFLNSKARSGNDFQADVNLGTTMNGEGDFYAVCSPNPAHIDDWRDLITLYLGEDGYIDRLESSLHWAVRKLNTTLPHKRNVVLAIPYPHITQAQFGRIPGVPKNLNFSVLKQSLHDATHSRLIATRWFVRECLRLWERKKYQHIHLLGFYWIYETVHRSWDVDDHVILKELKKTVNQSGHKMFWIPFFATYNFHLLDDYQSYYFDAAFLQPNYMFYTGGDDNLIRASEEASRRDAGIELEYFLQLDEPIRTVADRKQRFRNYLNKGIDLGYMKESACAHFQGMNALPQLYRHPDPIERQFYDDIYAFVKGTYIHKDDQTITGKWGNRVVIAIDLSETKLRSAVIEESGKVICQAEEDAVSEADGKPEDELLVRDHWHPIPEQAERVIGGLRKLILVTKKRLESEGYSVIGVGISVGGRVDWKHGIVLDSNGIFEGWENVPLMRYLEQELGLPVRIDSNGYCSALGVKDRLDNVEGKTILALNIADGISGGILVDGEIRQSSDKATGEFGHISVDVNGPLCTCGAHGCLRMYVSECAIKQLAREMNLMNNGQEVTVEAIAKLAGEGNQNARKIIEKTGMMLGAGMASLNNILRPDIIAVSGRVLQLGSLFTQTAGEEFSRRVKKGHNDSVELVFLSDLYDAELKGAAELIFEI